MPSALLRAADASLLRAAPRALAFSRKAVALLRAGAMFMDTVPWSQE